MVLVQALITPITAATVAVLGQSWSAGRREQRTGRGGLWYVRNVAKANRKAHTPVSNEINASSFSGARAKSEREQLNQHMRLTVRHVLLVENSRTECEMSLG